MRYRCAILDDYQNVALKLADWSKVSGDIDIKVFDEFYGNAAFGEIFSNDQGAYQMQITGSEVPLPAALPLFATIVAGGGLIAWRRRRKAAALAA